MNLMTKAVLFLVLVVFINLFPPGRGWPLRRRRRPSYSRDYPKRQRLLCPGSNSIKGLNGDWKYHCSPNPKCKSIYWKHRIVNTSTFEINHICRGYIKGIGYSRRNYVGFDRRFFISCCHDNQTESHEDCYWTGWQNCFGSSFKFWVPDGYYMAGIRSEYNSNSENRYSRIWDFYVCK